jgi:hypothetical protein
MVGLARATAERPSQPTGARRWRAADSSGIVGAQKNFWPVAPACFVQMCIAWGLHPAAH